MIVTSYNQEKYLADAIQSALDQTYKDREILVVDDGSIDRSPEIARYWAEKYPTDVKAIALGANRGVSVARNTAVTIATGTYLTTLDGDDRYLPDKLTQEVEKAERADRRAVVYSNFQWITADGRVTGVWDESEQRMPEGFILAEMFQCQFPKKHWGCGELMPRSLVGQTINDTSLPIYEDLDLKLRLSAKAEFMYCAAPAYQYRRHGLGLSASSAIIYFECTRRVWKKERHLLRRLPAASRRSISASWRRMIANHAVSAACQLLSRGSNGTALWMLLRSLAAHPQSVQARLLVRCLVPTGMRRQTSHIE